MERPGELRAAVLSSPSVVSSGVQNAVNPTKQPPSAPPSSVTASELLGVQPHANGMKNRTLPRLPSPPSSSKRSLPTNVVASESAEMDRHAQPCSLQETSACSDSPVPLAMASVKRTGKDNSDGNENGNGGKNINSVRQQNTKKISCGAVTDAIVATVTCGTAGVPMEIVYPNSPAPLPLSPQSHVSISETALAHNTTRVSPGGGSNNQTMSATHNLLALPLRVCSTADRPLPSSTMMTATAEAAAAATSSVRSESTALSNKLTQFAIGGSRRRNSITVPTSPYQDDGNEGEGTFLRDGVCSAGERGLVDLCHRTASDQSSRSKHLPQRHHTILKDVVSATDIADTPNTPFSLCTGYAAEDDGTSSAPPSSFSHVARIPSGPPSLASGTVTFLTSTFTTSGSYNAHTTPPLSAAVQGGGGRRRGSNGSTKNGSNVSTTTEHARGSMVMGPPPSPLVSPKANGVVSGGAGASNSPANRGSATHSRHDLQSPSSSLRMGTHDPYNVSAIVATPLLSGVPRTKSLASYRSPSAASTPIGQGIAHTHARVWNASTLVSGSVSGAGGNVAESGTSFSYNTVANSDTVSIKSNTADATRGTHDNMLIWTPGGGNGKLPLPAMGEYFLYGPQGPHGGCAVPQTARYAYDEPSAPSPTPYVAEGENRADAAGESPEPQYEADQATPGQRPCDLQYDCPYPHNDEQGQQFQCVRGCALPYETQPPERHRHKGPGQQPPPPRQQYDSSSDVRHHHPHHRRSDMAHGRPMPMLTQQDPLRQFSPQQRQPHDRCVYPQTPEQSCMYGYQAYADSPQHPLSNTQKQYPSLHVPPTNPLHQPHAHHARQQYNAHHRYSAQQPCYTQRPFAGRNGSAGATQHSWSGSRKRTAQDVLPGFFSEDTIQLGDQTHLVSDRNGIPYIPEQHQQQLGFEALHDAVHSAGDHDINNSPEDGQTSHQSFGLKTVPDIEKEVTLPVSTVMTSTLILGPQQQQSGCSTSVHYDAALTPEPPEELYNGSHAGARPVVAASSTSIHSSDDDEAIRRNLDVSRSSQSLHADQHGGNVPVVMVGSVVVLQPPHVSAPATSRAVSLRTGCGTHTPGGSSGGGQSNKVALSHNVVSGVTEPDANERGTSATACTPLGAVPSAATAVTTPGSHQRHASTSTEVVRSADVNPSHDGAIEPHSISSVSFVTPLSRSAGAMESDAAMEQQPSQGSTASIRDHVKGQQHEQRRVSVISGVMCDSKKTDTGDEYSSPVASPEKRRSSMSSEIESNLFGEMREPPQTQQQRQATSENGSRSNDCPHPSEKRTRGKRNGGYQRTGGE